MGRKCPSNDVTSAKGLDVSEIIPHAVHLHPRRSRLWIYLIQTRLESYSDTRAYYGRRHYERACHARWSGNTGGGSNQRTSGQPRTPVMYYWSTLARRTLGGACNLMNNTTRFSMVEERVREMLLVISASQMQSQTDNPGCARFRTSQPKASAIRVPID